jgi:predicted Zn-dependent peptidase
MSPMSERLELTSRELASGIRLTVAPMPAVHRVAVAVHVQSGPRFEPAELGGISHFLEHMLHRGIPNHPSAHAQALAFEELGAELSAATYADHTVLAAMGPPETASAVLELLGEVCSSPLFGNIEIERGIVREEILESSNDDGELVDPDDLVVELSFPAHSLGRPIIGTLEALERFDVEALRATHAQQYVGSGLFVSVAGAVDPERISNSAARAFEKLPRGRRLEDAPPAELDGPRLGHGRDTTSQTALRLAFRAPARRDPSEPACELLLRLLDDGMSTRLYSRICDELGLAYDVSASYEAFDGAGLLTLGSECVHERVPVLLKELLEIVTRLRDDGPTAAELDKAKRRAAWQMRALLDEPGEVVSFLGLAGLVGRSTALGARQEELLAVTRERVIDVAGRIFSPSNLALAAVGRQSAAQRKVIERVVREFR